MKIIGCLYNIDDIKKISFLDYLVVPTTYSIYYEKSFDENIEEIIKECESVHIIPIIDVSTIISEDLYSEVLAFIIKYIDKNCLFMYSDVSVLAYFKSINAIDRLIYNSPTYVCNKMDISYYKSLGLKCFISNELSIEDLKENSNFDNVICEVYGYYPIYYSKRRVLSLYKDYAKIALDIKNSFEMKEETRDEKYIVKEYDKNSHSVILNAFKICIFKELKDLKFEYIYVNTENIDILKLYKNALENGFDEKGELALNEICERVDKSLLYIRPSILNKDEKN